MRGVGLKRRPDGNAAVWREPLIRRKSNVAIVWRFSDNRAAIPDRPMISLQKLFGKDDKFFTLLEASGEAACNSVRSLSRILVAPGDNDIVAKFHATKELDKKITEQIGKELVNTFVTQLEREDIEVLSAALYRIPKTVEKFGRSTTITRSVVGTPSISGQQGANVQQMAT